MKIISQTSDELLLQEGNVSGMLIGGGFLIVAGVAAFYRHTNPNIIWLALAFALVGIGVLLFSSSITVKASRSSGQVFYQKKRLIGGKNVTYPINDILRIETRRQWRLENTQNPGNQEGNMPQPVLVAQSVIVLKNGNEVPLDHQKTSSNTSVGGVVLMSGQGKEIAMANQVAEFLGVPFQEISPPNMGTGLNINIG
jgi:hypothetical protein